MGSVAECQRLVKPLYKALRSATLRLSKELERHQTSDVFSMEEVSWLQRNAPGTLRSIEKGRESMLSTIKHEFSLPLLTSSVTGLTVHGSDGGSSKSSFLFEWDAAFDHSHPITADHSSPSLPASVASSGQGSSSSGSTITAESSQKVPQGGSTSGAAERPAMSLHLDSRNLETLISRNLLTGEGVDGLQELKEKLSRNETGRFIIIARDAVEGEDDMQNDMEGESEEGREGEEGRGMSEEEREMGRRLDKGFCLLTLLNRRVEQLQSHAVSKSSERVTDGIRVSVESHFQVQDQHYANSLFHYQVRICNEGLDEPVQLVSRLWVIKDFNGKEQRVGGPGVVGLQPVIEVGETFEYRSFTPLPTKRGTMEGTFFMLGTKSHKCFDVHVGPFGLITTL